MNTLANVRVSCAGVGALLGAWKSNSEVKVKVTQSCPTLCNPMDYSLPGSSVSSARCRSTGGKPATCGRQLERNQT